MSGFHMEYAEKRGLKYGIVPHNLKIGLLSSVISWAVHVTDYFVISRWYNNMPVLVNEMKFLLRLVRCIEWHCPPDKISSSGDLRPNTLPLGHGIFMSERWKEHFVPLNFNARAVCQTTISDFPSK